MREDFPIKQTLCRKAAFRNIPVNGAFELTPRCSLNCKMCYIRMTPEQMRPIGRERTAEEWIDLARQAVNEGLTFLLLTGGEPFVRGDVFEIIAALLRMGIIVDVNTNGTLIDETVADRLLECPPSKINITLYGASRETYEKLCGDGGAFDRVMKAIDLLLERKFLLCLNATLTPENAHEMDALSEIAQSKGLVLRTTGYVIPPSRRGERENAYRLSAEDAGKLSFRAQLLSNGEEVLKARGESQLLTENCFYETTEGISCLAGRSQFWITWHGKMLPCGMLPEVVADPWEEGFVEAWKKINHVARTLPGDGQCAGCAMRKLCPSCAAARYCETGDTATHCEYMCKYTEAFCNELRNLIAENP